MKDEMYYEYCLAKAVLHILVSKNILSEHEARLIDALNRIDFKIHIDVPTLF